MNDLNERLLDAWLSLTTTIINDRVVSEMPYNESLICSILYKNQRQDPTKKLTATDLCNETQMLKSQMNRTLTGMEKKGIISRERSARDKRQVFVTFHPERADAYRKQHGQILEMADAIIDRIGAEKAQEVIGLFESISQMAREIVR